MLIADKRTIESREGIELRLNKPVKHPANPLIVPELPWEHSRINVHDVLYDRDIGKFRMWYITIDKEEGIRQAYAESDDGIEWHRPQFNFVRYKGKKTNLLKIDRCLNRVIHDPRDKDPGRRYKGIEEGKAMVFTVWFSPDGLRWRPSRKNPVLTGVGDCHGGLGWDPLKRKYVAYPRVHVLQGMETWRTYRCYGYATSDNFEDWKIEYLFNIRDKHDPIGDFPYYVRPVQIEDYYLAIVPYLHLDTGHNDLFQTDPKGIEQTVDAQLAITYNGYSWDRLGRREVYFERGPFESWDDSMVWPAPPLEVDDKLWIYYAGDNYLHLYSEIPKAGKKINGRRIRGCIGLAILRKDGYMVARAGEKTGTITTRPFEARKNKISLNADAVGGYISASLLDGKGRIVKGFEDKNCVRVKADGVRLPLLWKEKNIASLAGRKVQLKLKLLQAKLYALYLD